jgi:lycopene cyclase domain-containing protein
MTYFGFLVRFVITPLLIFRLLLRLDRRRGRELPPSMRSWPEDGVVMAHAVVAVTYTTIWDNYLVASGVWDYDRDLVTGLRIGYVPIEEYSFFVLQSLMTGSWTLLMARRFSEPVPSVLIRTRTHQQIAAAMTAAWMLTMARLISGGASRKYMALIVGWALPPILFQIAFGGDMLWRQRRMLLASIVPASAYLGAMDSIAIGAGTWKINPKNTMGIEVIPNLPIEEAAFFLLTNVLLAFGVTLVLSTESENRLPQQLRPAYRRWKSALLGTEGVDQPGRHHLTRI